MTIEKLLSIGADDFSEASKDLNNEDISQLVEWLKEKDDKIRYQAFLLLKSRSEFSDDVYSYWDDFQSKLNSDNSYQRSIGLLLIAENTKWDKDDKMTFTIDAYLKHLYDEKPITIRQCIQALDKIVPYKKELLFKIADSLMSVLLAEIKETMRKLILVDILTILMLIRKYQSNSEIDSYVFSALSGEILDKKTKKQFEKEM